MMKELLNWAALSKKLTGNRWLIRKGYIPKKYQPIINEILKAIEKIINHEKENV